MKLRTYFFITILAFFCLLLPNIHAQNRDFDISANNSWNYDSEFRSSTKNTNLNKYTAVNWSTSDKSSHNMWFRVLDVEENVKGSMLFGYLTTNAFKTYLDAYKDYWLQARRENWWDPLTKVTGLWNA